MFKKNNLVTYIHKITMLLRLSREKKNGVACIAPIDVNKNQPL